MCLVIPWRAIFCPPSPEPQPRGRRKNTLFKVLLQHFLRDVDVAHLSRSVCLELSHSVCFYLFICVCVSVFMAEPMAHEGSPARCWIEAVATSLHHIQSNAGSELHPKPTAQLSNAGSLTYLVRSGIKHASSLILVRFVTTEPRWELPLYSF